MATRYPSDYDNAGRVEPGISRGGARPASRAGYGSAQRPAARSAASGRPAYSGSRPSGSRPSGSRPSSSGARRPVQQRPSGSQPRRTGNRRKKPNRTPLFAALGVLLVVVLAVVVLKPFGGRRDPVVDGPVVPASNPVQEPVAAPANPGFTEEDAGEAKQYDSIAEALGDADADIGSLATEDMATVTDLRMNTSLPAEWLNVLLLGTDERTLNDSARTDAIMICSINRNTGEVKLTSIMRDLAVEFTDIGKYNGTYRINAANYFGGPSLAMRTINEKFGMNIQYYVMVNFFGFQKIAERLGGIDIDITEAEMEQINHWAYNAYKIANKAGIDTSDVTWAKLEQYGENVHLNGTQTLAYARIRKLEGGDYMRSQRQRTVIDKLLEKAKKLDAIQLAALASEMISEVKTNLPFDEMFAVALQVVGNGIPSIEGLRLPINNSYTEQVRNEQAMLYDCDFQANALALYNFIYEQ